MRRSVLFALPALVFLAFVGLFFSRLGKNPGTVPSVLLNTPLPSFQLAALPGREKGLSSDDITGQVSLINVFASWCAACLYEHPTFMDVTEKNNVPIFGINWRERAPDDGTQWLARHGNPYQRVGVDPKGLAAVDLGVTQAPQTFVLDETGTIRYRHDGPVTEEVWQTVLHPLVQKLRSHT